MDKGECCTMLHLKWQIYTHTYTHTHAYFFLTTNFFKKKRSPKTHTLSHTSYDIMSFLLLDTYTKSLQTRVCDLSFPIQTFFYQSFKLERSSRAWQVMELRFEASCSAPAAYFGVAKRGPEQPGLPQVREKMEIWDF